MGPLEEIHIVYDEFDDDGELLEPKAEDLPVRAQGLEDEYEGLFLARQGRTFPIEAHSEIYSFP